MTKEVISFHESNTEGMNLRDIYGSLSETSKEFLDMKRKLWLYFSNSLYCKDTFDGFYLSGFDFKDDYLVIKKNDIYPDLGDSETYKYNKIGDKMIVAYVEGNRENALRFLETYPELLSYAYDKYYDYKDFGSLNFDSCSSNSNIDVHINDHYMCLRNKNSKELFEMGIDYDNLGCAINCSNEGINNVVNKDVLGFLSLIELPKDRVPDFIKRNPKDIKKKNK